MSVKSKLDYIVNFSGADKESESFEFWLKEKFFEDFSTYDWKSGDISVRIEVYKRTEGFTLDFNISGIIELICDRCLGYFKQEISSQEQLFVKFGDEEQELSDNVVLIPRGESQLDVSQFIYEYLVLAIPIKKTHPDLENGAPACDPEMIERLNQHSVEELEEEVDPRWNELKKLMDKK